MQSNTDQVMLQTLRLIAKGIIRFQQQCADPELLYWDGTYPGELELPFFQCIVGSVE
jgi:hypothetical protein